MNIAHFDCPAGICGSMILGALIDAGTKDNEGFGAADLEAELGKLDVPGWTLESEKIVEHGIAANRVRVRTDEHHPHRGLGTIEGIIEKSALSEFVKRNAKRTFQLLGEAEAAIHNTTVDRIHFHEVGAVDAIVDICGTWIALERLGIERVHASPINTGSGTVRCRHGLMPVPAPATAALLRTAGAPVYANHVPKELTTPTGAALIATWSEAFGADENERATMFGGLPALRRIRSLGYGAGEHELDVPNLLRVTIGETAANARIAASAPDGESAAPRFLNDTIRRLECTLDDTNPQWIGAAMDALYDAGALEAWTAPVSMKKGRPGTILTALCEAGRESAILEVIFRQTTTIGVRAESVDRFKLARESVRVDTEFGPVDVKVARGADGESVYNIAPEHDVCLRIARERDVPVKDVHAAAVAAARHLR